MGEGEQDLLEWLAQAGLRGQEPNEIFREFCARCNNIGLPIDYAIGLMDTLHPEFEGHLLEWETEDERARPVRTYTAQDSIHSRENWENSVFHHFLRTGQNEARRNFAKGAQADFYRLPQLRAEGYVDFYARIERFTAKGRIGAMDALYSAWATRSAEGFAEEHFATLRRLVPTLALALKSVGSIRIVKTLARVYLGQDAASRVIDGQIARGQTQTIDAVIWLSDLKSYTALVDGARPEQIIPLLNDYSGLVIDAVHKNGGNVLKLIGDGVLAIFKGPDLSAACQHALEAEALMRKNLVELNARREKDGDPLTGVYLGLHLGRVFYGNIGSRNRLDFTVVGPTVNEVSRICAVCKTEGRDTLVSDEFAGTCAEGHRSTLSRLGEFSLRGVSEPMDLFEVRSHKA